jgi:precorrin-4/cobalt-precorrin-4 C11-methyltransferase
MRKLDALGIDYEVTPGVSAYAATSAALKKELTLPDVAQTVILTRTAVRSSSMPNGEDLDTLGKTGATLAIHLSVNNLAHVQRTLIPHYGEDCPVVVAYRVTWPDEMFIHGTLGDIREKVKASGITRTALIMVGRVLGTDNFDDSRLYAADHHHVLRPRVK